MKINSANVNNFLTQYHQGKYPHQRIGQAFCNAFGVTNPRLFYVYDENVACSIIWDIVIDYLDRYGDTYET